MHKEYREVILDENDEPIAVIDYFGRAYEPRVPVKGQSSRPWSVIDGANRLLTLRAFMRNEYSFHGKWYPKKPELLKHNPAPEGTTCDACGRGRFRYEKRVLFTPIDDKRSRRSTNKHKIPVLFYELANGHQICEKCEPTTGSHLKANLTPKEWGSNMGSHIAENWTIMEEEE